MWNKRWAFASHHWTAAWEPLPEPDGHIGQLKLTHRLSLFGFMLTILDLNVVAQQVSAVLESAELESVLFSGLLIEITDHNATN